jgi:orotate phosphoribosyltransferase
VAVLIALDRMERAGAEDDLSVGSAVQEVGKRYGLPVITIATLEDIMSVIENQPAISVHASAVQAYRQRYGIA